MMHEYIRALCEAKQTHNIFKSSHTVLHWFNLCLILGWHCSRKWIEGATLVFFSERGKLRVRVNGIVVLLRVLS